MGFISRKVLPACGNMCVCCPALRPSSQHPVKRYKKLLSQIFPKNLDDPPNDRKILKLCEYASRNPLRLPKIAKFLEQRSYKELRSDHVNFIRIITETYCKLLLLCKEQMAYFAGSLLNVILELLDDKRAETVHVIGFRTLTQFIYNQADATYAHSIESLVHRVCEICKKEESSRLLRAASLESLSATVWFMREFSHLFAGFDEIVVVALENYDPDRHVSQFGGAPFFQRTGKTLIWRRASGGKGRGEFYSIPQEMGWEIVHVPDKVSAPKESSVNVLASNVEPKLASTIMRELSQIAPLEDLRHVKRIRRKQTQGKSELSIVLYPFIDDVNNLGSIPDGVQKLIDNYDLSPFTAAVPKYPATSKEEWEEQCKLWPTSFHPMANGIYDTGFGEEDTLWIISCMQTTLKLANLIHFDDQVTNAAMIVDPLCQQIIACAIDQTPMNTDSARAYLESLSKVNGDNFGKIFQEYTTEKSTADCMSVSCLHPWTWAQNSSKDLTWHPLKHAAMVAVDSSAARDRRLFPRHSLSKRQKTENPQDLAEPPYLCTGFDIYLAWEPCAMCAMALVHQRVRRIFFALPNLNAGALGSIHRLQGERSLNHHYSVFKVSTS